MSWKRAISHLLSKKEWLNSTAFVFQFSILLSLTTYYLFRDFFTGVFLGYALTMLLLCLVAFILTLLALRKTISFRGITAPGNLLFVAGLCLLSAEALFHSFGADVLRFPHSVSFFAGVLLLTAGAYLVAKLTDFENKHTVVLMLWITGNLLLLFAVSKHWYENTAFSVRDSIVLFGGSIISLLGVFQHILITNYSREIDSATLLGDAKYVSGKFDEAMEHYESGLKLDPKNEYLIVRKGMTLLRMGLNENAYTLFSTASAEFPDSPEILMGAGIAATKLGRHRTALEHFRRVEKIQRTAELYTNIGNVLFNTGKVDAALASYRKAIELDRSYENAYLNAANVLTRARRFEEALALVNALLKLNPGSAEAHYQLSKIYLEMGDYEKSIEEVDAAIMLKPSFSDAWIGRGALMERIRQGKIEIQPAPIPSSSRKATVLNILRLRIFSTLEEYQKLASAMTPSAASELQESAETKETLEHARNAFVKKNWELAVKAGRKVLENQPDNLDALLIVANSLEAMGNYRDASTSYRRAAEISGRAETYIRAAITAAMAGFWLEAVESTDAMLEKNRENAEAWVLKGLLLYFLEVPLSSIECFEYALAFQPENKDALYGKGLALMKLGLESEAAACFSQANAVSIHFTEVFSKLPEKKKSLKDYLRYAAELAHQKKFEEAIRFLNFVLKVKGDDENVCYFAAVIYGAMKKYRKAEELLRKAIEKDPDNPNFITATSEILRKDGRAEEGVRLIEEYLAEHKDPPADLIAEYALSLCEINADEKAREFMEAALRKEPDNERVRRASRNLKVA
ncbi:MAG: tetratricopeptide repeat protein [Thermoplasmata archaeon]|nr:tetratricopeptide repeat protein [Thermoplasmata archaeon]